MHFPIFAVLLTPLLILTSLVLAKAQMDSPYQPSSLGTTVQTTTIAVPPTPLSNTLLTPSARRSAARRAQDRAQAAFERANDALHTILQLFDHITEPINRATRAITITKALNSVISDGDKELMRREDWFFDCFHESMIEMYDRAVEDTQKAKDILDQALIREWLVIAERVSISPHSALIHPPPILASFVGS